MTLRSRIVLAYLLMFAGFLTLAVGFWHRQEMDVRRQRFSEKYGLIEVSDALYFDTQAALVRLPVLLIWFGLQVASAAVFLVNWRRAMLLCWLSFWPLWLASWLGVIALTNPTMFA
jgi:hypothetical protein